MQDLFGQKLPNMQPRVWLPPLPRRRQVRRRIQVTVGMYAKFQKIMDQVILVVSIVGPFTTAPQAIKIWASKSADGVSLFTWAAYFSISVCWLLYGISKKD